MLIYEFRLTFGVGTPQRINDLLKEGKQFVDYGCRVAKFIQGALSTKYLKRIIIDASHVDQKRYGILEMRETHGQLMKLLDLPLLKDAFEKETELKVIFY